MPLQAPDISYILNDCVIKLPGSSDKGLKQELWGVVREFLQDSNAWIEHQELLVTAGKHHYTVGPRDGGQIIRLVGVQDGNCIPVPATMSNLGVLEIHQKIDVSSVAVAPGDHTHSASHPWRFCIVKNIVLPATKDDIPVAPAFIGSVYSGTIIDGILGKSMLQQQKSYTNVPLGNYHLKRFRDGIGIARTDAWNQNLLGGQRWRFPSTWSTHTQRGGSVQTWPAETF